MCDAKVVVSSFFMHLQQQNKSLSQCHNIEVDPLCFEFEWQFERIY